MLETGWLLWMLFALLFFFSVMTWPWSWNVLLRKSSEILWEGLSRSLSVDRVRRVVKERVRCDAFISSVKYPETHQAMDGLASRQTGPGCKYVDTIKSGISANH